MAIFCDQVESVIIIKVVTIVNNELMIQCLDQLHLSQILLGVVAFKGVDVHHFDAADRPKNLGAALMDGGAGAKTRHFAYRVMGEERVGRLHYVAGERHLLSKLLPGQTSNALLSIFNSDQSEFCL